MEDEVLFYVKSVEGRKQEIESSSWLADVLKQLDSVAQSVDEIRCLALGSVSDFVNPRFQLALLLLISSKLGPKKITAWDPIFTEHDKLVLAHYNIEVCENDPTGSDSLLWYVPHGPFSLVLDLPSKLGRDIYIGNDLSAFNLEDKSEKQRAVIEDYKAHSRILPIKTSRQDRWFLAFSSTAIHRRLE